MGRRRATWSSNEYFAQKKNVGEEVKLKYNIVTIERHYGLVKDALKYKVNDERRSLKNLRKSTGHSIEALPPTPFQSHTRENTIDTIPAIKPLTSTELPPEYRYLENDIDHQQNVVLVEILGDGDVRQDNDQKGLSTMNKCQNEDQRIPHLAPNLNRYSKRDEKLSDADNGRLFLPSLTTCTKNSASLSPKSDGVIKQNGPKIQEKDHSRNESVLPLTIEFCTRPAAAGIHSFQDDDSFLRPKYVSKSKLQNRFNQYEFSAPVCMDIIIPKSPCSTIPHRLDTDDNRNEVDASQNKHTSESVLSSVESKRLQKGEKDRNDSRGYAGSRREQQTQKEHQTKQRQNHLLMRDIRTRCRTCAERFRQNAEFQKRKKVKEQQERIQRQNEMEKRFHPKDKPFILSADDLESLLSDEVLDYKDHREGQTKPNKVNRCKKRFSRQRMEELAQPRASRKRKPLFSKQLIRKEADILIASHSHPELTEREKERVRMLESKIRMFLAMMQGSLVPSKMVDIPQREDIMNVDISHH